MKLYSMRSSGNSYKVRLLLALLGGPCLTVDLESGDPALQAARDAGVLPYGKLPTLELDDGRAIAESNAILCYLGEGTALWPADAVTRAQMLGWMFWEQYSHEPVIAVRAALRSYPERAHLATPERMADLLERGHAALALMEQRLTRADWLAGQAASLADICLYGYTHSAGERGGFDMALFPAIDRWLQRIAALPGHEGLNG